MLARLKSLFASKPAAPQLTEIGLTGTPIFGGYLRDLGEYNPELMGLSAYQTYEKMRRGDTTVAATLAAVKLPIKSAEWTVTAPDDATPVEEEARDFIREQLFERNSFRRIIDNALLMLDFGAAAHEDVWAIDGNRVVLAKAAPRLPQTFYQWDVSPHGETLNALIQYGYQGSWMNMPRIPASKLALFTYRREGANFAGRSMLREAYRHWYAKDALYRIDGIALERNGLGIPTIILGPDAKKEDRAVCQTFLNSIATHQKTSIMLPNGYTFKMEGITGQVRDCKESIHHHNVQISLAALAQFLMLGEQKGARSLGDTLSDFFAMGVQSVAQDIAEVLNQTTIARLAEFNFGDARRGVRAPKLVVQQILSLRFETITEALSKLATAGLVLGDDELDGYLRDKMGLPDPDKATARKPLPAQPEKPITASEFTPRRAPRGAEKFLALAEITNALDRGRDEVAAALRAARPALQTEVLHKLAAAPVRTMHRVSIAPDAGLIAKVETILAGVSGFGFDQVEAEAKRQRVQLAERKPKREPLGVYADAAVSEFTNTLQSRATNVVLDKKRRGDLRAGELIREADADLDEQSDKWIDGVASKAANQSFADGRADGYEDHKDEISKVIYSSLLDGNTCEVCSEADGKEGETPDDIPSVPNPDCLGGDKCRCVHVFVFADEKEAA